MSQDHLDLYQIHEHDTPTEPLRPAYGPDRPDDGRDDPDGTETLERHDGDGEHVATETWTAYDRAML